MPCLVVESIGNSVRGRRGLFLSPLQRDCVGCRRALAGRCGQANDEEQTLRRAEGRRASPPSRVPAPHLRSVRFGRSFGSRYCATLGRQRREQRATGAPARRNDAADRVHLHGPMRNGAKTGSVCARGRGRRVTRGAARPRRRAWQAAGRARATPLHRTGVGWVGAVARRSSVYPSRTNVCRF